MAHLQLGEISIYENSMSCWKKIVSFKIFQALNCDILEIAKYQKMYFWFVKIIQKLISVWVDASTTGVRDNT
jgi:hypothetical protein